MEKFESLFNNLSTKDQKLFVAAMKRQLKWQYEKKNQFYMDAEERLHQLIEQDAYVGTIEAQQERVELLLEEGKAIRALYKSL